MSARRYLSLMFADLVGFTSLSERLEPEALGELLASYQACLADIIGRHGGHLVSCFGDGALAYFGFPSAHENDAERAVLAGLEICDRVKRLETDPPLQGAKLAVRVGLHTGLVVVGPTLLGGITQSDDVVGMAANIAHRVQSLAAPNTVFVSGDTMSLLGGLFDATTIGRQTLRGLSTPIAVHRILGRRQDANRSQGRLLRGAVRLVGRKAALEQLDDLWAKTAHRGCTVVQVLGEPGIGKTRLVQEFCSRLALPPQHIMLASCSELFATSPLHPVIQILRTRLGARPDHRPEDLRDRLRPFLAERGLTTEADLAAACALLGLDPAAAQPQGGQGRTRQFTLVAALVERVVRSGPSVLWIDDVHWLDPSSAELLGEMVQRLSDAPLMVIMTQRRLTSVQGLPPIHETIHLHSLQRHDALELTRSVPGAESLNPDLLRQIADAADGVPLFLEQLILFVLGQQGQGQARGQTRGQVQDQGQHRGPANALHVPLSLSEMMASRLDRVPGGRAFALAASCIGRTFDAALVARLLALSPADTDAITQRLVDAELLVAGPDPDQYLFRHALLHRAAYDATMRADRQKHHAAIHAALTDPASAWTAPPELLAHHLTEAGAGAAACAAWIDAGSHASRQSAHAEALVHLEQAAALLAPLPPATRTPLELKMLVTSVAPLSARHGSASRVLELCCRRGLDLSLETGPSRVVFPFLYGHCTVLMSRASAPEALQLARSFIHLAEREHNLVGQVIARRLAGMAAMMTGDFAGAKRDVELSLALYDTAARPSATETYGHDALVFGGSLLGLVRFCMGDTDTGVEDGLDALDNADELRHPHSIAIATGYASWILALSGSPIAMNQEARRLIRISEEHRLGVFESIGWALLGWSLCLEGELDQGTVVLRRALAELDRAEFGMGVPGYIAVLADAERRRGRLDEARQLAAQALATVSPGNRWLEPEVRRVAALLETLPQAIASLQVAADLARDQANVVFEQRCLQDLVDRADGPARAQAAARLERLALPHDLALRVAQHKRLARSSAAASGRF